MEAVERLGLARLMIDVDGSVVRTGAKVAWAFRGFNPHQTPARLFAGAGEGPPLEPGAWRTRPASRPSVPCLPGVSTAI